MNVYQIFLALQDAFKAVLAGFEAVTSDNVRYAPGHLSHV